MLAIYIFRIPVLWIVPLVIQIISYTRILKKMGKRPLMGIIPVLGEYEMSTDLLRWMRSFWRPVIITAALCITVLIIGANNIYGLILNLVALMVYGVFLIRLYWVLAKQFGKGGFFRLGLIIFPLLFLLILAFGKSTYLGKPEYKPAKEHSPTARKVRKVGVVLITIVELAALILGCFYITTMVRPLKPVARYILNETEKRLAVVSDSDEIVSRADTLGADHERIVEEQRTRDYFFPDHSSDDKVVVMSYIIGSNLEDSMGAATINISQMKSATSMGDGLDFVMQTGGSDRWFTDGIEDSTVGRYLISGGNLEKVQELDSDLCMSEPQSLNDFIVWTKENYPADRYMLVMWDHGGGFASGYGQDDLNRRSESYGLMTASEIISAIADAGIKFDLIGFDACLMQNVEFANAFEPYADYYLASEESEPATGWFYTSGFGKLAEDPGMSTEDLAKSIISSYDQCNRAINEGEPQHEFTLSLVDLTLIKPVYESLTDLYEDMTDDIAQDPVVFANMSAGRSRAYQFQDDEQVDMVSYLTSLKNADYRQRVAKDEELDRISQAAKACVVYRNSDSAEGVNGISIDFPYTDLSTYTDEHAQLKAVKYEKERTFFNTFCSIMASQQASQSEEIDSFWGFLNIGDYSDEEWYIKGFEDYDTTNLFIDIPVTETEDGYLPELPDKTWDTILDCKTAAYLVTDEGLIYLGREHFSETDEEGHPLVVMDGIWARVNGHIVCYETEEPLVTEEGTIYRGKVKAKLNGTENITLHIEWDPVIDESEDGLSGHVKGYSLDDEKESFFTKKGLEQFKTGDVIEFIFDFYDEEGNLIKTETYGDKLRVITEDRLTVKDELFAPGTIIQYFGVLTDVYQRELMTEELMGQVE